MVGWLGGPRMGVRTLASTSLVRAVNVAPVTMDHRGEGVSWLLASAVAERLGPRYELSEEHPLDGQYDVLTFRAGVGLPSVRLNREGSVQVHVPDGRQVSVTNSEVWDELAHGYRPIVDVVQAVIAQVDAQAQPMPGTNVLKVIAAIMRTSSLFGLGWRCRWSLHDSSGYEGSRVRRELLSPYLDQLNIQPVDRMTYDAAMEDKHLKNLWFVVADDMTPIACMDLRGFIHRPDAPGVELAPDYAGAPPATVASAITGTAVTQAAKRRPAQKPGLGLAAVLEAFNRKERYFLLGGAALGLSEDEISGPSMTLASGFRDAIGSVTGWEVPAHAWVGMDYHLGWLHAALRWVEGDTWPHKHPPLPENTSDAGVSLVSGNQEDSDLIIGWSTPQGDRVVLVEAKAYGAWTKKQLESKLTRVHGILEARTGSPPPCDIQFVLASPKPPTLTAGDFPEFEFAWHPNGTALAWVPLPVPGARLGTTRTDDAGRSTAQGKHWAIIGPSRGF